MTVKTTRAAGNQYISAPDHASFSIPAGDFTIGFILGMSGVVSGDPQYLISNGGFGAAGSFNITYEPGGGILKIWSGTNTNLSNPTLAGTVVLAAGEIWAYFVERAGSVLSLQRFPILANAPADGSAMQTDTTAALNTALSFNSASGMHIGTRADRNVARMSDQSLGRVFVMAGLLTSLEKARLAFGEDVIAQLGKTVNWYVRLDTVDDLADRGPSANVFEKSGTPTTSTVQPAFGYTPAAEAPVILADPVINAPVTVGTQASYTPAAATGSPTPTPSQQWVLAGVDVGTTFTPAPSDAGKSLAVRQIATSTAGSVARTSSPVTIQALAENRVTANPIDVDRVIQRGFAVTLSCAYLGTTPTLIDFALYAATGSTLAQGWTALSGATISGGTASASAILPAGGPYRLAMRTRNGSGVIAESAPTTETFLIGADVGILGSSSAEYLYLSQSGDGFTVDPLTKTLDVGATAWGALSTTGAAALLSAGLRTAANVPIGLLPSGSSGSKLTEWLNTSGTLWTRFLAQLAKAGGKLEFAYVTVGSNDADVSSWTSPTPHFDNMRQFITNIRAACGQPSLPIVWVGSNRRTNIPNAQADFLRAAENMIGSEPNVTLITTVDQPMGDGTHMTATGFQNTVRRVSAVAGRRLFGDGVYMRGPMLTQGLFQNNRLRMKLTHRNGTDFTPGAGYTGITIADGVDALTFTTEKFSTTEFDIVGSRNFVAPVVKYQSGANPTVTAPIFDNGATPLPMQPESGIVVSAGDLALVDATAPVMTGSITVTNVTTSGATLSCPAATDAVGVAGYEYSINGGTSYSEIPNAARSVVVSGRPAGTVHPVRMRAFDTAGNRAAPLSASFTTLTGQPPAQDQVIAINIAASRAVKFPGGTRVVAFGSKPEGVTPNAPYLEAGKWWDAKHPLDERYWVADVTIDLTERGTTATSVVAIVAGVVVLEQPVIQGKLIPVKLGGFNAATGAANFCTFRITCANGERFDRTIWFKQQVGAWSLDKDADDESFYVADIGNDLVDSNTTASAVLALPVGVTVLVPAVIQGPLILVKLGGMDTLPAGVNYCDLRIDCANTERFYRTIQFNRVDN